MHRYFLNYFYEDIVKKEPGSLGIQRKYSTSCTFPALLKKSCAASGRVGCCGAICSSDAKGLILFSAGKTKASRKISILYSELAKLF